MDATLLSPISHNHDHHDHRRHRRTEAFGEQWQEHFVDVERASATLSVGVAVSKSLSYVTISDFATLEERLILQDSALDLQQRTCSSEEKGEDEEGGSHIMFASDANVNCTRYSVETLLNEGAKAVSSTLQHRLLRFLSGSENQEDDAGMQLSPQPPKTQQRGGGGGQEAMTNLARQVFGISNTSHLTNLQDMTAVWYSEPDDRGKLHPEPKVNIYREGGYFSRHADGMDLTLLVVLSTDFEGGGTAFYLDDDNNEENGTLSSAATDSKQEDTEVSGSIAKPPAGTAMIWGGTLEHMAHPVTKGMRAVYVGSFDLKDHDSCAVDEETFQ